MPKPLLPRLAAVAAAAALTLTACGSDDASTTSPGSSGLDKVTVADAADADTTPKVEFKADSVKVDATEDRVIKAGDGAELDGTELLSFDYAIFSAKTGKELDSNYAGDPVGLDLADETVLPGLSAGLKGQKVGSRVLIAIPPKEAFGEGGNERLGIEGDESLLFLVDILSAITPLSEATGAAVEPKEGLPTVEMVAGEPATITVPKDYADPKSTIVQPLITGEGEEVTAGQMIRVTYTGVTTREGKVFDSSANSPKGYAEFPIGVGNVIQGWDKGLVGQKVGSRVLLVIPAAEGYGAEGREPDIKGGDTLVFVVDILAAY
ncbi:MAG TPA: FKBP-type peptidyl-prolyl cis-trans isomerase [Intrasporangiaceae bacterium]|nr:FKBP-type peptidyl-prolyl cis-trans isomerase [Intrasporangiaceae bacterium]